MSSIRSESIKALYERTPREIEFPRNKTPLNSGPGNDPLLLSKLFASKVFNYEKMRERLPKPVYEKFIAQLKSVNGERAHGLLDKTIADAVAHAVRVWAQENGATHFTHWFQPHTNSTAEKHDSFLHLKMTTNGVQLETMALDQFSGSSLIQAEPDASSFPHGGVRTTFEARGYTIWDPTSPMFLQAGPHGTSILYIPSVFISYNGEALDEKTGLLRSMESVSKASLRVLKLLGDSESSLVKVTLGTEQEFFLVDRGLYSHRPDLKTTGRTLVGSAPPKHQQLEDHYFGNIPSRVLACISEAELELWKLGVPIKTRHNEVAPNQFEIAPIFEDANIAVDHNLLTMEMLHKVAHRHKLKALFHEKPFKGVNGSGKHCNWSLSTDKGKNLLDPEGSPEENMSFLVFLTSTLIAVYKYGGLLRSGIASASNDHRLGANEAPPAIVSVFLGEQLNEVLNAVEENRPVKLSSKLELKTVSVGGRSLDIKVSTLPEISRDLTDRNRTSPFAFTGNKFEFRAVGSKQSPSFPVTLLNAAVSSGLEEVANALEKKKASTGGKLDKKEIYEVLREFIKSTKPIRFEGNNYSEEWKTEAARRGLPNIKTATEAYEQLLVPKNIKMLTEDFHIFTAAEVKSRYHVLMEKYFKDLVIEGKTMSEMATTLLFPAIFKYRKELATAYLAIHQLKDSTCPEKSTFDKISPLLAKAYSTVEELDGKVEKLDKFATETAEQTQASKETLTLMDTFRGLTDKLEVLIDDSLWPIPKYNDLFFS